MFPFLSQPPQQKRRLPPPLTPSSSRRRSNSGTLPHPYSHISAWASRVQPGSPAPCSPPHRRPSTSSRRRASQSKAPSGSFVAAQRTPSSATGEYPADLTAVGYTSLFLQFDRTPTTPSPFKTCIGNGATVATPLTSHVFGSIPIPPVPPLPPTTPQTAKRTGLQRFRSLSILRPKKWKHSAQPALGSSPVKSPKFAKKVESAAIAQHKRAKYAGKKASTKPPPSLANEIALMQFMDGGTVNDNVKKLMEARAKAAGGVGENGVGVEGVYRDGKGGIWYDADEEMEYAHLLGDEEDGGEWEDQNENIADRSEDDFVVVIGPVVNTASPNTIAYCPLDIRRSPTSTRTSPVSPRMMTHSKPALLSLPCRPRRNLRRPSSSNAYAHLSNTPTYLIDIDAFAPRSPNPKSPRPSNKKHRPRPAPLQLSSSQSAHARANAKVALVTLNGKYIKGSSSPSRVPLMSTMNSPSLPHKITGLSPSSLDRARREFVEDSFQPTMKVESLESPKLGVKKALSTPKSC